MSRGHGRTQRAILEAVATDGTSYSLPEVAQLVYGDDDPAHYEATRRAVRTLQTDGHLATGRQVRSVATAQAATERLMRYLEEIRDRRSQAV